jgi:hypothetical protein
MIFILVAALAGLVGTWGMTAVLYLIDRSGRVNADMVRALGSAVTRSLETALFPGLLIHFLAGIPFAMLYIGIFTLFGVSGLQSLIAVGGLLGFGHGFAFSFILVILAEHHPVARFQEAGYPVAVAHFVGHIVFGLLVGLVTGLTGYR